MSRRLSFLLVLFVLVLAACSGGGGTKPSGETASKADNGGNNEATGDPCRFVTEDEVEAAVGTEVAKTTPSGDSCQYENSEDVALFGYVYIKQGGKAAFENQKKNFQGVQEVPGIGDGALYFPGGGMYVLKGDAIVNMTIFSNPNLADNDAAKRPAIEKIAKAIAGRM